jgi:hypothetical protein
VRGWGWGRRERGRGGRAGLARRSEGRAARGCGRTERSRGGKEEDDRKKEVNRYFVVPFGQWDTEGDRKRKMNE